MRAGRAEGRMGPVLARQQPGVFQETREGQGPAAGATGLEMGWRGRGAVGEARCQAAARDGADLGTPPPSP